MIETVIYKKTYIQAKWNWKKWRNNPNGIETIEEITEIEGIKRI